MKFRIKETVERGDRMYLTDTIIEWENGDHPRFVMGEFGDEVEVLCVFDLRSEWPYCVKLVKDEGDKGFYVSRKELMFTKPTWRKINVLWKDNL